jgi:hypothetical protein
MENHLDENEIAQYMDAIEAGKQDELTTEIRAHVEECFECKVEIVETLELLQTKCPL